MQKLRIPVTQVLGLDPGKFQSSQSRLEFLGSMANPIFNSKQKQIGIQEDMV